MNSKEIYAEFLGRLENYANLPLPPTHSLPYADAYLARAENEAIRSYFTFALRSLKANDWRPNDKTSLDELWGFLNKARRSISDEYTGADQGGIYRPADVLKDLPSAGDPPMELSQEQQHRLWWGRIGVPPHTMGQIVRDLWALSHGEHAIKQRQAWLRRQVSETVRSWGMPFNHPSDGRVVWDKYDPKSLAQHLIRQQWVLEHLPHRELASNRLFEETFIDGLRQGFHNAYDRHHWKTGAAKEKKKFIQAVSDEMGLELQRPLEDLFAAHKVRTR